MFVLLGIARAAVCISFVCCASLPYMSICAGVVIAVALKQVDDAPDTKPSAQRDHKGLQNSDCRIEKCHKKSPFCRLCGCPKKGKKTAASFGNCRGRKSPRRARSCGAAVFSCRLMGLCCLPGRGAYHVAGVYVSDRQTTSFMLICFYE